MQLCVFHCLQLNVSALEDSTTTSTETPIEMVAETSDSEQLLANSFSNSIRLEDIDVSESQLNGITVEETDGISLYSNSAPVAGLTVVVANQESILNGKATTDTILLWLWYDGTTAYTYDPDGDEIASRYVNVINDYIISDVRLNDEVVGFATQITRAAEYNFDYYVYDSVGNRSNTARYRIEIEPADGNSRPVCTVNVSNAAPYANTNVYFDWSNSYDADSNDYIMSALVRINDGSGYETVTQNSDCWVAGDINGITLKFRRAGTYNIIISLADNHNNWSNWVGGTIDVSGIITLVDTEWVDSKYVRWRPTGSNSYMYHTLYSRLGGEIKVNAEEAVLLSSYSKHDATYTNVYIAPILPGAVFMSAETWSSATGNPNSYNDPVFGLATPRAITASDIQYLRENDEGYYVVYSTDYRVIDFYSNLNPLIAYGWSNPVITY